MTFAVEEVDEHVLTERVGRGEEGAAAVEPGHLLDEVAQCGRRIEHERVDTDAVAGAPCHLAHRCFNGLVHRWIVEEHLAVIHHVGSRFPVGDHHDLSGSGLAGEQLPGETQTVLHVRSVHEIPRDCGQIGRVEDPRHLAEADDSQVIAGEP